jgi:hypothetical protein
MSARPWTRGAFALLMVCASVTAYGQVPQPAAPGARTPCSLVSQPTTRFRTDTIAGGGRVTFVGGGVLIKCPSRSITLKGDSAEQYPDRDFMVGNVVYDEPRFHLTSNFLNRFNIDDRIVAVGNVNARLPSGSTLVGPIAEYKAASPRIRPRRQLVATQRPTITVVEKDSTGKPAPPMNVVADSVFMDGDSLIYGSGQVIITRPELRATADSAFIDQGKETMKLWQKPELTGKKDRPFTLTGSLIDLFSKNRKLQRVIAREKATAVSDSMTLRSDTIDLRIRNDVLDHAYAWGAKSRARADSPSQNLLADSLDVTMPNSKVRLVRALRKAYAETRVDTTRFKPDPSDRHDWLRGDTIVAHFDSATAKDTSKAPNIKQLVASGHASSFYHLAPSDSGERRPAIDYLIARLITIDFNNQHRVATVTAVDSVSGVYVEPRADTTARRVRASGPAPNAPKTIIPLPSKKP